MEKLDKTKTATDGSGFYTGIPSIPAVLVAYALMGGVMAAASYAIVLHNGLLLAPPHSGTMITAGLLPTLAGMMAGFLYWQFAGLVPLYVGPKFSIEALTAS